MSEKDNLTKNGPVFIVGMNGSGTTLLADCLSNSPELYVFPRETRMIPWLIVNLPTFKDLSIPENRKKLLDVISKFKVFKVLQEDALRSELATVTPTLANILDIIFTYLAKKEGKERWVEKSPMNLQFILQIAELFPTAQFIHIYRDGRDVARSNHRRFRKNPYWTIFRWRQIVQRGRRDGEQMDSERYLEISYEDLTRSPEETLTQVCNFVGIQFTPRLLECAWPADAVSGQRARKQKSGTIVQNSTLWKSYFTAAQLEKLEHIAGKLLAELGYNPTNRQGAESPSKWQLYFWRCTNVVSHGIQYLKMNSLAFSTPNKIFKRFFQGMKYISVLKE